MTDLDELMQQILDEADPDRRQALKNNPSFPDIVKLFRDGHAARAEMERQGTWHGAEHRPSSAGVGGQSLNMVIKTLIQTTVGGAIPTAVVDAMFEEHLQRLQDDTNEGVEHMIMAHAVVTSFQIMKLDMMLSGADALDDLDKLTMIKARLGREMTRLLATLSTVRQARLRGQPAVQLYGNEQVIAQFNTVNLGDPN